MQKPIFKNKNVSSKKRKEKKRVKKNGIERTNTNKWKFKNKPTIRW